MSLRRRQANLLNYRHNGRIRPVFLVRLGNTLLSGQMLKTVFFIVPALTFRYFCLLLAAGMDLLPDDKTLIIFYCFTS